LLLSRNVGAQPGYRTETLSQRHRADALSQLALLTVIAPAASPRLTSRKNSPRGPEPTLLAWKSNGIAAQICKNDRAMNGPSSARDELDVAGIAGQTKLVDLLGPNLQLAASFVDKHQALHDGCQPDIPFLAGIFSPGDKQRQISHL